MEKDILEKQNKKNKWKQLKDNKKFWKWTLGSLAAIAFGASAVMNITYIPKYFALKNNDEGIVNTNISATDDQNNLLFTIQYQSQMKTLGDLMASNDTTYHLKMTGWGRYLTGITYFNNSGKEVELSENSENYWAIYYNGSTAQVGIDDLFLHMGDTFQLKYTKITL